jgi:hypothetical protein
MFHPLSFFPDLVDNVLSLDQKAEGQFDAVIDKATFDSVLCGDGSVENIQKLLTGVSQFLFPSVPSYTINFSLYHISSSEF